jgi:hypothetical protein
VRLRVAYSTREELADAVTQMAHGAILVRSTEQPDFDAAVELELALPDGSSLTASSRVLQVLPGHGVAVTIDPTIADKLRAASSSTRSRTATIVPAAVEELTHAQKIHLAMHGNRDQRNAIMRDKNRALHVYVLKNPNMNLDDVIAIAKNTQVAPEMYKQISERQDWFSRPQVAIALARNPKVPGEIAIRALAHVAPDALRGLAKGVGAPPHVIQAARRKVIDK